jgi:HSP20 family molecular chaperone IbpA
MATETQELQKREAQVPEGGERTRTRQVFLPRTDIYETSDAIMVAADMPGVKEDGLDITLEKNELTFRGKVGRYVPEKTRAMYQEYDMGDYERSFVLSDEVARDQIEATLKEGVLYLTLPKVKEATTRKIPVKTG